MTEPIDTTADIWVAIPAYNNAATVARTVAGCLRHVSRVLVVDDGSRDADLTRLLESRDGLTVLRHAVNRGKGCALRTALRHVAERGGRVMIALDGDGQHDPDDLPKFLAVLREAPDALVIGCRDFSVPSVPAASRCGRRWANFWVRLLTGRDPGDAQSGFRAYPVEPLRKLRLRGRRYEFETEVLVKAAWGGLPFRTVDVAVSYAAQQRALSSFRPWRDNLLITHAHVLLVLRRLLPWPHRRLVPAKTGLRELLTHPQRFMRALLHEHATPSALALSAAVGVFLATLPLISLHMIVIFYVTTRFNLNRVMALSVQNLCMPPLVPFLCIQLGHLLRTGRWLTEATRETIVHQAHYRLLEWLMGSLILAPLLAALAWLAVFYTASRLTRKTARGSAADTSATPPARSQATPATPRRRGNRLGFWFFRAALRCAGLRGAYGLVYPVCLHYLLFDRSAVRAALAYARRRFPERSRVGRLRAVYRLFVEQGKNLIDRHCLTGGRHPFVIEFEGRERLTVALGDAQRGFVLLMSHMGNWQTVLATIGHLGRKTGLLMRPEDNAAVRQTLKIDADGATASVVSPNGYLGGVIEMMARLKRGEIVSIMGDRAYGAAAETVPFLGEPARFPVGAWRLAAGAECPVVVLLPAKLSTRRYRIRVAGVFHPRLEPGCDRRARLREWVRAYAALLEDHLREFPYQCFLFYDIWNEAPTENQPTAKRKTS
jgi:predicted LPLAT superfamily acyltransferase/uncharacterized protein (DUF2062 family)